MAADADRRSPAPGARDDAMRDPDILAFADAIANGTWHLPGERPTTDRPAGSILGELDIIGRLARVHTRAPGVDATDSNDSLGDVLARTLQAAEDRPDLSRARRWGPLYVLEQVGDGSFGEVYRAWDPALDREVALKLLRLQSTGAKASAVVREGRLLASVHHPNVISVYGAAEIDGEVGIWMEFVRGRTLERIVLDDGPMSAREAAVVGESLCSALAAVHQKGLLHRDVKAANVMRAAGGRIVLLDFGTGAEAVADPGAGARRMAGTPLYMAPEVLEGAGATVQSDLYSLGVLLFFVVSGTYPVYGKSLLAVKEAHAEGRRVLLADVRSDLPASFIRAVDQALAPNPPQRYSSAGAFLEKLAVEDPERTTSAWVRYLLAAALSVAGFGTAMTLLGAVTTRYFNAMLGRSAFADEGLRDWFYWGAVSSVAPGVLFIFALIAVNLLAVCWRLLVRSSAAARRAERAMVGLASRRHLNDTSTLASLALLVSAAGLIGTWWYFTPLLTSLWNLFPNVSTTAAGNLAILSPEFAPYRETYRASFTWVTIACVFLWYQVLHRTARRGETLNWGILAGGIAVTLLSVLLLDFPYRLMVHSEFEAARWRGHTCYIIGERDSDVLLFCPALEPPRNRTVPRASPELEPTGDGLHNIFSNLQTQP